MNSIETYITERDFDTLRWKKKIEFTVNNTKIVLKYLKGAKTNGK